MKKLFLLPAVALFGLVGCGQQPAAPAEPEKVVVPTVTDSSIKTAYDAAAALAHNAVTAQEYTFSGVCVAMSGNSFFLQDGYCGMYIYNKATEGLEVGKTATVTATLTNYYTLIETKAVSSSVAGEAGTLPAAVKVLTLEQLGQLRENILVNVELEFVSKNKTWDGSNAAIVTAKLRRDGKTTEEEIKVKYDKWAFEATQGAIVNALAAGDVFKIENLVTSGNDSTSSAVAGKSNQLLVAKTSVTTKL